MTLTVGARLGSYDILSPIGAGGMGEVYRARDTKLGREVALKVLPEAFTHDAERVARFQREAHTLAALNHPNIAHIYGIEEADGVTALVMELVEGEDLSQRIARGAIPIDEALPMAKQIAEALETAHEQGIIHRDLKPANIKVRSDGTVKVLDFGLAKATDTGAGGAGTAGQAGMSMSPTLTTPAMTQAGMILGTAAYMSPEQARGRVVDKRADIWAFGCVLYEMLTGQRAFPGEGVSDTLASVLKTDPNWRALPAGAPAGLRRLLHRCLEKDAKRRLQAIGEARVQIEDLLAGPPEEPAETAPAWRASDLRSAWPFVAAAALLAVALAVPTTLCVRRGGSDYPLTRLDLVTPPTTDPFSFALSPDGRQMVIVAVGERGSQLWLRPLGQTDARPLAGTEGASAPFWAPDGRQLGFFADAKLKRIDLNGGPPQVLVDATTGRGGTWNRDGVIVYGTGTNSGVWRVPASGGTPTELTRVTSGQIGHRWPQFLPDGRRFLFFAVGPPAVEGAYIGSLDAAGEATRVLAADSAAVYAAPGYLLVVSQGVLVAHPFDAARGVVTSDPASVAPAVAVDQGNFRGGFAVSATGLLAYRHAGAGRRQLTWTDRTGRPQGVLISPEETGLSYVELAPDGERVAVMRSVQGNQDIWLIEVARGLLSRFTNDPALDGSPVWSPDGGHVVFRSNRRGKWDLFRKPATGTEDEQPLLVTPQDKAPQSWSSDGQFLLYAVQDRNTQSDLWAVPLSGDRTPFPVVQTRFDDVQGQFSPDGRWVAYVSNETGRYEVYVQPFRGPGSKSQVSTSGGVTPRWGRDGMELFYVTPDNRMMAASLRPAAKGSTPGRSLPVELFPTRLTAGNTGTAGAFSRAQYAVAADGRFLLNVTADDAASAIAIIENWTALLRK